MEGKRRYVLYSTCKIFSSSKKEYLGLKSFLTGRVDKNSPAAAAGLKKGDIIVEINGVNVTEASFGQLQSMIKDRESTVFLVADRECWVRFSFPISEISDQLS